MSSGKHCVKSVQIRIHFWSVFSCFRTEYSKIRTRSNSVFGHQIFWRKLIKRRIQNPVEHLRMDFLEKWLNSAANNYFHKKAWFWILLCKWQNIPLDKHLLPARQVKWFGKAFKIIKNILVSYHQTLQNVVSQEASYFGDLKETYFEPKHLYASGNARIINRTWNLQRPVTN